MNNQSGQRVIALLPMKANSSRVPGKNFRDFCGKPLFRWVLETLLSVEEIDQVVINTDARLILKENGLIESGRILIRDRKPEICGDNVSMNLVLADDIANVPADFYLMTHTTNPLLSKSTIERGLKVLRDGVSSSLIDSVFTVNKIQARFYHKDGRAINHDPENLIPTQDLEPWFEENSNLYIFTSQSFATTQARIGGMPFLLEQDPVESVDIDTPSDWDLAERIAQSRLDI